MELNIFEQAARKKIRFATIKGEVTVEQLFDMNLESRNGYDLDAVARAVHQDIKATEEQSFVKTSSNPAKAINELKMAIVMFVIEDKQRAEKAATASAAKKREKAQLLEILAQKQSAALLDLTPEQIEARLAELDK